jgi:hypothetical protein
VFAKWGENEYDLGIERTYPLEDIPERRFKVLPIDKNKKPKALPLLTF